MGAEQPVPMEFITFLATIRESSSAITFSGRPEEAGRVHFEVPGTQIAPLAKMLLMKGRLLRVTVVPVDDPKKDLTTWDEPALSSDYDPAATP